jgi:hypothetical protein
MQFNKLENMVRGWLVGSFEPSVYKTSDVEFAVQRFMKGSHEKRHFHKIATEITVIINGTAKMNGIEYLSGSIIVIEPNESTDFQAMTDVTTAVLKIPGALNDKYLVEDDNV